MHHDIKIHTDHFAPTATGMKRAELQYNDRDYQRGDTVTMREVHAGRLTGAKVMVLITHIIHHAEFPEGLPLGWCMFSHIPTDDSIAQ